MSPIIATANSFAIELAPEGLHEGIIVDVLDLGKVKDKISGKIARKIKLVIELTDAKDSEGRPFYATKPMTLSLNPKSTLYKLIRTLTGVKAENNFDVESFLLTPVSVYLSHFDGDSGAKFLRIEEIGKGRGGALPSGLYKPWLRGEFKIGFAREDSTPSGKPFTALQDENGSDLGRLWADSDREAVKDGAKRIEAFYRDKEDGTIKFRDGSVRVIA